MTDATFDLTGKVALVTGGSRGVGRAMSDAFAARGADLIIASRKQDACESAAREITTRFGVTALPVACKPLPGSARQAAMGHMQAHQIAFGRTDALVRAARSLLHETVSAACEDAKAHSELALELLPDPATRLIESRGLPDLPAGAAPLTAMWRPLAPAPSGC